MTLHDYFAPIKKQGGFIKTLEKKIGLTYLEYQRICRARFVNTDDFELLISAARIVNPACRCIEITRNDTRVIYALEEFCPPSLDHLFPLPKELSSQPDHA
jgi:hypothetical protein